MILVHNDISVVNDVTGMVAELKVHDKSNTPILECFHNMSWVAASLAMKVLIYKFQELW